MGKLPKNTGETDDRSNDNGDPFGHAQFDSNNTWNNNVGNNRGNNTGNHVGDNTGNNARNDANHHHNKISKDGSKVNSGNVMRGAPSANVIASQITGTIKF